MSSYPRSERPLSVLDIQKFRDQGDRFVMITAYDFPTAQVLDEAGIPIIFVGDSLGMVVLGYDSTTPVTMDEMIHHTKAVRRGVQHGLLVADMPFGAYQVNEDQAVANAIRFVAEAGANAVKLEGHYPALTRRLVSTGIPVMAHLGLTPQSHNALGGYRIQGRGEDAVTVLEEQAVSMQEAGAFALVLESIPSPVGTAVTEALTIPTIGIGAGPDTSGQVLVCNDLFGITTGRLPRFVKKYADVRGETLAAAQAFATDVAEGTYPGPEHQYT